VTQNPNFDSDFFGGLRSLAIHYNLSLVPATRRELVELCHSEEIKGSPFFNIFATVILKPFTEEETDLLITQYGQSSGINFTQAERSFFKNSGGGYPFFTQMIGHYLVCGKQDGLQEQKLFDFAKTEFSQQAEPHFSYIWAHATESEKITLVSILALQAEKAEQPEFKITVEKVSEIYPRAPKDINSLTKRGSIVSYGDQISLFSSCYDDWIALELTAAPGEEESEATVDDWMRAQKDAELQHSKEVLTKTKKKYWPVVGEVFKEFSAEVLGNIAVGFIKGMI